MPGSSGCFANAIFAGILGSLFAGTLMQMRENRYGNYAWRLHVVWGFVTQAITLVLYIMLYREWKRLGGKHGYKPLSPNEPADS